MPMNGSELDVAMQMGQVSPMLNIVQGIVAIATMVGMRKTFEKAGKPGRSAIIPVYNLYIMLKIIGKSGHRLRRIFFPPVFIILTLIWKFKLAKAYGKGGGFGRGLILLPFIFFPILGFGDAKYLGVENKIEKKENGNLE